MLIRTQPRLVAIFITALISPFTHANNIPARMELCGVIKDDNQRLSCFDDLFSREEHLYSKPPDLITGHGQWIGMIKQRIQRKVHTSMLLPDSSVSPEEIYTPGGFFQDKSFLRIDCSKQKSSVFIHWPRDLGHREIALDFSFNNEKAKRQVWEVTLDGNIVRPTSDEDRLEFFDRAWYANTLRITIPRNGLTQQYHLTGLQGLSNAMKEECTWPRKK